MKRSRVGFSFFLTVLFAVSSLSAQVVELQFWDMPWGPTEYIEAASKLVAKYNATHPGVVVKYQSTPWTNWYQTFATAIASGTAPDISTGAGYQAFQFSQIGGILPIDDVVASLKSSGKISDFAVDTVEMMKYKGHYVALPWHTDIRVMYYRTDLLQKAGVAPPKTWDEFRSALKKVTDKKNGVFGMAVGGAGNMGTHTLLTFLINNGGGLFDKDGKLTVQTERNRETLNFLSNLVKDGSLNPASAGYSGDDAIRAFVSGKSATLLDNPGLDVRYPELKDKIGILDPLIGPHGDQGTLAWANNIMLYTQSKHPKETKDFLIWYSENSLPLFVDGHISGFPIRKSFSNDPYYAKNALATKILTQYVPIAKSTGSLSTGLFPELNELEGDGTLAKTFQGIVLGKSVDSLLKDLEKGASAIMKKNN